jgi:hypothetical protein
MALRPPPALLRRALPCVRCQTQGPLLRRSYARSSVPVPPRSRRPAQLLTALGAVAALVVVLAPRPSHPPRDGSAPSATASGSSSNADAAPPSRLEPERFRTFRLRSRDCATSTQATDSTGDGAHVVLRVPVAPPSDAPAAALGILTLHLAHPLLSVQRPYTPLYAAPLLEGGDATLLIKRYRDGEVGRYAHELRAGDEMLLRGPEYSWRARGDESDLLLVSGRAGHGQRQTCRSERPSYPPRPRSPAARASRQCTSCSRRCSVRPTRH